MNPFLNPHKKDLSWMQEPLPTYSEAHYKLVRALAPLAGNPESYTRSELVRLVRRKYPELSKNDIKPQKHCRNYGPSTPCACHQSDDALFEKLDAPDGNHRYRVLAVEAAPVNFARPVQKPGPARPQAAASAFARAPVTPASRPLPPAPQAPEPKTLKLNSLKLKASKFKSFRTVVPSLDLNGFLPRLKQWLFGEKLSSSVSMQSRSMASRSLPPLPPLPPLPVAEVQVSMAEIPVSSVETVLPKAEAPILTPEPLPQIVSTAAVADSSSQDLPPSQPSPVLQVLRLPAPGGVQRLMVQHLTLSADAKLHLKLSPSEREVSIELVHLHFRDSVVRELAVIGNEPLEIGFRLLGSAKVNSRIELHGLCDGEWRLLQTSEQSFPVLPEPTYTQFLSDQHFPLLREQAEPGPSDKLFAQSPEQPHLVQEPLVQELVFQEPVVQEPVAQEPVAQEPAVQEPVVQEPDVQELSAPVSESVDDTAWLDEVPEIYRPMLLHIQTHGSLGEGAMIGLLGGGNAGARKARAFAVQVDKWQGCLPFEIEILHTPEGKTYSRA